MVIYGIFSWLVCAFHQYMSDLVCVLSDMRTRRDPGWLARITDLRTLMVIFESSAVLLTLHGIVSTDVWCVNEKIFYTLVGMMPTVECYAFVVFFMESFRIQGSFILESVEWAVGREKKDNDSPPYIQQHHHHQYPNLIHPDPDPDHIHDINNRTDDYYVLPRIKILEQRVSRVRLYIYIYLFPQKKT